ncbi:MAG: bifunctional precorrin-2 dehydrogenase/sirohydrochlorin ferrochelatase [Sulfurimonas sp.]
MGYFPAFLKLDNKKILIVGGGVIAHEKLLHLLDFTTDIVIIAKELSDAMRQTIAEYELHYEKRAYKEGDIEGFFVVVVAVDAIALQKSIYEECQNSSTLCNAVDATAYCDFIFPSYIKKGDLTIAVSTSGASPAVAKHLRRYLQEMIPDTIVSFLEEMKGLRKTLPKGKERMKMFDEKAKKYIESWRR